MEARQKEGEREAEERHKTGEKEKKGQGRRTTKIKIKEEGIRGKEEKGKAGK